MLYKNLESLKGSDFWFFVVPFLIHKFLELKINKPPYSLDDKQIIDDKNQKIENDKMDQSICI